MGNIFIGTYCLQSNIWHLEKKKKNSHTSTFLVWVCYRTRIQGDEISVKTTWMKESLCRRLWLINYGNVCDIIAAIKIHFRWWMPENMRCSELPWTSFSEMNSDSVLALNRNYPTPMLLIPLPSSYFPFPWLLWYDWCKPFLIYSLVLQNPWLFVWGFAEPSSDIGPTDTQSYCFSCAYIHEEPPDSRL